ncbi:transporter suffix domain-containing protein [Bordetella sp. LUAb4]|uniref:transporter suffix domain-containing protein n=1 Tax=Bordetella sp. LUAb4 TaxID=2843195 RepID=UPI001E55AC0D|nr:transporter suffix domain-containing protein [Bordetella sp. LUAb4]
MAMSDDSAAADTASGWRFKLGIVLFVLAFAIWLLVPLAGAMGASGARLATLTGAVFLANKVVMVACIAVMGKAGFQRLKAAAFGHAKRLAPVKTVGPTRHAIGLVMFSVPLLSSVLAPYISRVWPDSDQSMWQIQVLGDVVLLASFFVLGGNFWSKLHALFIRTA